MKIETRFGVGDEVYIVRLDKSDICDIRIRRDTVESITVYEYGFVKYNLINSSEEYSCNDLISISDRDGLINKIEDEYSKGGW